MVVLGLRAWHQRTKLIDFCCLASPLFGDADKSHLLAKFNVVAATVLAPPTSGPAPHAGSSFDPATADRSFRVTRGPLELDRHEPLISLDPGVVAGMDVVHVARPEVGFGAVVVADVKPSL